MPSLRKLWSNFTTPGLYIPFRILILAEMCWAIIFCVFIAWIQKQENIGYDGLRVELILLAFHVFTVATIIGLMEDKNRPWPMSLFVWLVLTVFTDLWSVLQLYKHVPSILPTEQVYLNSLQGLSIVGIVLSGLAVPAYVMVLIGQRMEMNKAKRFDETSSKDETSLLLSNSVNGKINHRMRV